MPDVLMPRLSDTMTEGVLSQWLMSEGDEVHRGDVLAEVETDKAVMDLEAFDSGKLTAILVQAGTTVPIGQPVAVIGERSAAPAGGSSAPSQDAAAQPAPAPADDAGGQQADRAGGQDRTPGRPVDSAAGTAAPQAGTPGGSGAGHGGRVRATPLVRAIARDNDIDLSTVTGSGPAGRIVRVDIERAIAAGRTGPGGSEQAEAAAPGAAAAAVPVGDQDEQVPLSQIRRITAQRLTQSASAPHFYLTAVVDAAALLQFRTQVNEQLAGDGVKISVTDLLVRACAVVLRAHPQVNSSWAGDHIVRRGRVNVGVAVAIDDGLIVPVIPDADRKSVRQISDQAHQLSSRAREGRLKPEEFSGGTFTVSNLGMFGIDQFTAVINPPEAAILAVGSAVQEPVVRDDQVVVTTRMRLTLTVDHRVLDGATGAAFLRDLVHTLEQPLRIVT